MTDYMIDCENLVKIYKTRDLEVLALQGLDLQVRTGEVMATSAVIIRFLGSSTSEERIVRLNSPSACSRVSVGASAAPFGANTVRFSVLLRHSSIASGVRTISMCERYSCSLMSG